MPLRQTRPTKIPNLCWRRSTGLVNQRLPMRLFMPLLLGAVFTAASVASARDAGTDTSLCDTIAAAHVDPPTLQDYVFKYPLEQLSKGERPFIESAGYMGRPATEPI